MEKTIIIRITNPTKAQDALLQRLMRAFRAEQIEVQENSASTLLTGSLQIDPQRRLVWQVGQTVDLTPMEFDILLLMARRPGQVFTARQIYEAVATDSFDASWTGKKWGLTAPFITMQLARVTRRDFDGKINVVTTVDQTASNSIEDAMAPGFAN